MAMSIHDWNRWYVSTYCRVKGEDKIHYVSEVLEKQIDDAVLSVVDKHLKDRRTVKFSELDFTVPELGYFNVKDVAVYAEWTGKRQWKKGLNPEGIRLSPEGYGPRHLEADKLFDLYEYLIKGDFLTYEEAYKKIYAREGQSYALSRNYAMALHQAVNVPVLFHRRSPVGFCKKEGVELVHDFAYAEVNSFARVL